MLAPGLGLEIWDDRQLLTVIRKTFGLELPDLAGDRLLELGDAIDRAKATQAFGPAATMDPLQSTLLWHFAYWRLGQLREAGCRDARAVLPPGQYAAVVVLMADLCAYSSYVRDTRDDRVIRESLTAVASKTRYRIMNDGGMLYQFLGDTVIGFFGIPAPGPDDASRALACARGLLDVGASVAEQWQRQIDRVQPAAGVHVAMALGDVQMVSLRPFSRAHIGAVAEAINLAARLIDVSGPGEIVISNTLCHGCPTRSGRRSPSSSRSRPRTLAGSEPGSSDRPGRRSRRRVAQAHQDAARSRQAQAPFHAAVQWPRRAGRPRRPRGGRERPGPAHRGRAGEPRGQGPRGRDSC